MQKGVNYTIYQMIQNMETHATNIYVNAHWIRTSDAVPFML